MSASNSSAFLSVRGRKLEYRRIAGAADGPTLVFLHEGLGSIGQWRDFPARIANETGLPAIVYARYGYGQSDVLQQPFGVDFMHREALECLPELLRALGIERPILIGHSDGASIALIYAGSGYPLRALVALAPHVFVEDISIRGIVAAKQAFESSDLPRKLARYHRDPMKTFYGWNDVWLAPAFRSWNIERFLPAIGCPLLAIQGYGDEYGTMAQVDAIARQAGGPVAVLKLDDCGHSPHRDQPETVATAIADFVRQCGGAQQFPRPE
ncbi:MAG: alpha/beta hydrolase [Burkholderiales bacterium]|jgi:pimeloyl-ACP methyl ester carboxylesterase